MSIEQLFISAILQKKLDIELALCIPAEYLVEKNTTKAYTMLRNEYTSVGTIKDEMFLIIANECNISLKETIDSVHSILNAIESIAKNRIIKNSVIKTAEEIKTMSESSVRNKVATLMNTITEMEISNVGICDLACLQKETLERIFSNKLAGKPTGSSHLDELISLVEGELIVVAARPSVGKTSFAITLMDSISRNGDKQLFITIEIPAYMALIKLLAINTNIPIKMLREGGNTRRERIQSFVNDVFPSKKIDIVESGGELMDVIKKIYVSEAKVIFIDYLQLMSKGGETNRNLEISAITRALKKIAVRLRVTIVLLSQLSRGAESRKDTTPVLTDLRDSGAIEQDADIVMFLHRVDAGVDIIVAKNRNGKTGTRGFNIINDTTRFVQR